jgi:TRAP-type C4-dicarboxylate transport system substrate-binding protein
MMRSFARLIAAALAAIALPAAAQTVLNVNTALTTDDPMYAGLERMKAAVEKRTAGKLQIRIFPGSQLGKDEDVLEQARAGANVAVLVDGGRLAPFVKEFGILGAPYLFDSYDRTRRSSPAGSRSCAARRTTRCCRSTGSRATGTC